MKQGSTGLDRYKAPSAWKFNEPLKHLQRFEGCQAYAHVLKHLKQPNRLSASCCKQTSGAAPPAGNPLRVGTAVFVL